MINSTLWNQLLIWPIVNVLVFFYKIFEALHIPGPLGWSVILMTITIRAILYPVMNAQMKSAKKMAELKPHLDALNAKHKDDKAALQQAQMALYKEHGINPAAGCLPLIIQMPVLIALYNVFYQVLGTGNAQKLVGEINQIIYHPWLKLGSLDLTFLGTNLGVKPSQWQTHGWWLLTIPLITAGLQYWQTKLMMPTNKESGMKNQESRKSDNTSLIKKEEPKKSETDTAAEMQKQMALISPIMFAVFAYQFPVGLALYWNVFGLFGIMQQLKVNKQK